MKYLARITNNAEQLLSEHLQITASMSVNAVPETFRVVAKYAGLWHDLGKYRQQWQQYLRHGGQRVYHSPQGAVLALQMAGKEPPAIAYIIAGHHSGLSERLKIRGDEYRKMAEGLDECIETAKQEITNLIPDELPDINLPPLRREFAIRMLFSVLVDSDRLDARNFESPQYEELSAYFKLSFNPHSHSSELLPAIVKARNVFAHYCSNASKLPKGIFRLTGPCGIGKTIASAKFAYLHHQHHQMSGVVYVGPLKSIIEQTASVYRSLFGQEAVLEHHSGFEVKAEEEKQYKLNTERWDKQIIVTSGVQFYESLFANTPGKCRKLQGLINKVILLDESQSIPNHLVRPILDVLNTLVKDWGCTIVLMSATQPAFINLNTNDVNAVDIIPDNITAELFQQFNRVKYQYIKDIWQWKDIVKSINYSGINQGLLIVNTIQLANEGYQVLSEQLESNQIDEKSCFHLSSRMCPAHRSQILIRIRRLLKEGKSCFLVSTPVVEAGVDVDFPMVYRQLAPLDSIIQAAGRCNREGKKDKGDVIIFKMQSQDPQGYIQPINITKKILDNKHDKYDINTNTLPLINIYFRTLFNQNHDGGLHIQKLREDYDYPKVAQNFKVIEDEHQISVVVRWGDGERLIEEMKNKDYLTELDWRKLQQFIVNIPKKFQNHSKIGQMNIWLGDYQETGIVEV